jgi:hypothetical protein
MNCEPGLITDRTVIIRKSTTPFRALPPASEVIFPGLYAWSPVPTTIVTAVLGVDPGAWNVWRNRRLTPAPLPPTWFRRASGSPLVYQVSDILTWLAARRGDQLDTLTTWRLSLLRDLGIEVVDPDEVRKLVCLYARAAGPVVGDVRFTPTGFQAYLDSLGSRTDNIPHWR